MGRKLYYCRHRLEGGVCVKCRLGQDDLATAGAPGRGSLPDWATGHRRATPATPPRTVTLDTAVFDPWTLSPLGPSLVAAGAPTEVGTSRRPFPGRPQLPVDGPPSFLTAVRRVLRELQERAPHRYEEALRYLPQARYDPERLRRESPGAAGRSDGLFSIDGSNYDSLRFVFLHEVGHNVRGEFHDGRPVRYSNEDEANDYAHMVIRELG